MIPDGWLPASNAAGPVWSLDEVATTINGQNSSITGRTWTPAWQTSRTHDFDGNLTSDGRWNYTLDADNRLSRMQSTAAAVTAGVPHQRIDLVYDWQGRRVAKHVYSSTNGSTWTFQSGRRFLYDGWNLIAEYSAASAAPGAALTLTASHTWGIDVSGTAQGAGGVGGLLASTLHDGAAAETFLPSFDGNGNISAWSDPGGALLVRSDYSPSGQLVARYRLGPPGDTRPDRLSFGFSTKYTDAESGLLYYGYRYLDPVAGRWLSRDPIGENGGANLYGMVGNNPISRIDVLGLADLGPIEVPANCHCPINFKISGNFVTRQTGRRKQRVTLDADISVEKVLRNDAADDDCECSKIRLIQTIQRFTEDANGNERPVGDPGGDWRTAVTNDEGWRIDWKDPNIDPMPGSIPPWLDTTPYAKPGSPVSPATFDDTPGVDNASEGVRIFTCAVYEKDDGTATVMGCLEWGYYVDSIGWPAVPDKGKDQRLPNTRLLEGTPRAHCGMPPEVKGAINKWNEVFKRPHSQPWDMDPLPPIGTAE